MPYSKNQVPSGTERVPPHGQAIYRAVFNSAHSSGKSEEVAHAIAWAAVKKKYKKKGEAWVSRDAASLSWLDGDEPGHPFRGNQFSGGKPGTIVHVTPGGRHDVRIAPKKGYEIYRTEGTHAVKVASIGFEGAEGFRRVHAELARRENKDSNLVDWSEASREAAVAARRAAAKEKPGSQEKLAKYRAAEARYNKELRENGENHPRTVAAEREMLKAHREYGVVHRRERGGNAMHWSGGGYHAERQGEFRFARAAHGTAHVDKDFSEERRKKLAKEGKAEPGGSYPIENEADLKRAIKAFGRSSNKPETKAFIKKRARALGKMELLPENWDSLPAWATRDAETIVADWNAVAEDAMKKCEDCGGTGMYADGSECVMCDGTGYEGDLDYEENDGEMEEDDEDMMDAAGRIHMTDAFIIDAPRKTKDGYLVANARIARTGIQLYSGSEIGIPDMKTVRVYRPPEEVFDRAAMRSMSTLPITMDHPPVMVTAKNWKKYAVGDTGEDVARDGECIRVPLIIKDSKAIEAYENGIRELSVGYTTELRIENGTTPEGETYDAVQTAIRGNHLAVVPAARGGSRLRIGDDMETGGTQMPVKILVDGQSVAIEDEVSAKHINAYLASLQSQLADAKKAAAEAEEEQEEEKKVRGERDALRGEMAVLKKQLEDAIAANGPAVMDARIKERMDVVAKANAFMGGKVDFEGRDTADVMKTVVLHHLGDSAKAFNVGEVAAAFKAIVANVKTVNGTDKLAAGLNDLRFVQPGRSGIEDARMQAKQAYEERLKSLGDAWRQPNGSTTQQ